MVITTKEILDELTAKAKENPRLRCNLDMRNSADDQSQRMHTNISMMKMATSRIPLIWCQVEWC